MNNIKEKLQARIKDPNFKSISCNDGWLHLLYQLHFEITLIDPDFEILQIKEKFGGLRFYYKPTDPSFRPAIDKLISFYEALSYKTCEITGLPGKLMFKNGVYKTLNSSYLDEGWQEVSHLTTTSLTQFPDFNTKQLFNEDSLLNDIIMQWGEHGAHAEVCTYLINEVKDLRTMIQNLVHAEKAYAQTYSQYENENPALDKLNELWDQLMALPWIE